MSHRWVRFFLACLFSCAQASLFCGVAGAQQSRRFNLTWQAPAGCATEADVIREIDGLVANSAPAAQNITIAANASVESDHGGFTLTLIVRDVEGSHGRRLEAPTCEELGHAAALIVALAIDPALLATQSFPSGTTTFTPTGPSVEPNTTQLPNAPSGPIPTAARAESPAPIVIPDVAREPLFWRLGLTAFAGYRTLPGTNLGTGLFGAIQTKGLRLELAASSLTAEASSANAPGRSATFALYRIASRVCWLVTEKAWSAGPCAGVELGRLSGSGHGVTYGKDPKQLWLGSTMGGLLELRVASSSVLGISADLEVPWVKYQFGFVNDPILFETGIAARFGFSFAAGWR